MPTSEIRNGVEKRIESVQRRFKRTRRGAALQIFLGQQVGAGLMVAAAMLFVPDHWGYVRRDVTLPFDWIIFAIAGLLALWGVYVLTRIGAKSDLTPRGGAAGEEKSADVEP